MRKPGKHIAVVGSLNIDYIASVERLPAPGETLSATALLQCFGGKGANQAVAAARQGARVSMIGSVGNDDAGRAYCRRLASEGINIAAISTSGRSLTGTALIAVDKSAENMIIVAAGANGDLKPAAIREARPAIRGAAMVLLQFEVPMPAVIEAVRIAAKANVPVVLNPSPFRAGFPWGKLRLDTLIVNEVEAGEIFPSMPASTSLDISKWQRKIENMRVDTLVITRGARPTICIRPQDAFEVAGMKVKPVDTVGAGDAFAGTYVARRAEGADVATAIRYASCAGALATLKRGAQESIPGRDSTDKSFNSLWRRRP
jgi:ribokinase